MEAMIGYITKDQGQPHYQIKTFNISSQVFILIFNFDFFYFVITIYKDIGQFSQKSHNGIPDTFIFETTIGKWHLNNNDE